MNETTEQNQKQKIINKLCVIELNSTENIHKNRVYRIIHILYKHIATNNINHNKK